MKIIKVILLACVMAPFMANAQDEGNAEKKEKSNKPERAAFESSWLINSPTNVTFKKKTLEFAIQHRFGLFNGGNNDLIGIWAPSNIRLALTYNVMDRVAVGFGTTKDNRLQDFNVKAVLLRQTKSNKIPINLSYYANLAIDARNKENFINSSDRYSYFHELIISRRFSRYISFQISPSFSHYNIVPSTMPNDQFTIAVGGQAKVSAQIAILAEYSLPIVQNDTNKPQDGLSLGIEMSTGGHSFQVFVGNYNGIVPQKNYMFNQHSISNGDFLIGFNITRLFHL